MPTHLYYQKYKKKYQLYAIQHKDYYRKYHQERWQRLMSLPEFVEKEKLRQQNRKRNRKQGRLWYQKNKNVISEQRKERRKKNLGYNIGISFSVQIRRALKNQKNNQKWENLIGYTLKDLMNYLEKKFDDKMNWNNYGNYWVIDHIKPQSLFKFNSYQDEEFKKCWSLENLQPLEKIANLKKSNKLNWR